jgi:hypothetical protein
MEKAAAAEIDTGSRSSTGGDGELDWGAQEPASSIEYKN